VESRVREEPAKAGFLNQPGSILIEQLLVLGVRQAKQCSDCNKCHVRTEGTGVSFEASVVVRFYLPWEPDTNSAPARLTPSGS